MIPSMKRIIRKSGRPTKLVAVVTPVHRLPLTADENISLRHLQHYLGEYDRIMIAPSSLTLDFPGFQLIRFADAYFRGIAGYNRLMVSPVFYEAFRDYEIGRAHV